jgi:hypothetical protein
MTILRVKGEGRREKAELTDFTPEYRRFCLMPYPFSLVGDTVSVSC